jgi:trehalose 6-phosphate synthase/phosphatase
MSLVIVSNRLPVSVKKVDGKLEFSQGDGGLARGLGDYTKGKRRGTKWIGWPGLPSDNLSAVERRVITARLRQYRCYPVFLTQKQIDDYYNGYSNSVVWPMFHDLPIKTGYNNRTWEAYHKVNELFASETLRLSNPGSTVWVHDYQLMLVPQMLRTQRLHDQIGFFLHTPFPPAKVFADSKHAPLLMAGLLGASLVGFHTSSYAHNFLETCRLMEAGTPVDGQLVLPNRSVQVGVFPIGIDYAKFAAATRQRAVQLQYRKLVRKYAGKKVIATVDRLDMTKGFVERLEAYRTLLQDNPKLRGQVVMVMLAIPTRGEITEYKKLRERVEKLVSDINKQFGDARWEPIDYLYQTMPFDELAALYRRADVAFVAPLRDGMNLVAKEYVASQKKDSGVLVLSKTAGAAEELKQAVQVDPTKPETLVHGLRRALNMSTRELQKRTQAMQEHLQEFTIQKWADSFITRLQHPPIPTPQRTRMLGVRQSQHLLAGYHAANRRLILLDYDGTLTPLVRRPEDAEPSKELRSLLRRLAKNPLNDVVIVSGRDRHTLQKWLGDLPIGLAAEHGALFRRIGGKNWHKLTSADQSWQEIVLGLFDYFADLVPGAHVEQKEWSLTWHYRQASLYLAQKNLVALRRLLKPIANKYDLRVKDGNKILEVHTSDISKAKVAQEWLLHDYDFIFCAGDDTTDEDMLSALPSSAWTIKVGHSQTHARYRVKNVDEVLSLLSRF